MFTTLDPLFVLLPREQSPPVHSSPSLPAPEPISSSNSPLSDHDDNTEESAQIDCILPAIVPPKNKEKGKFGLTYVKTKLKAINDLIYQLDDQPDVISELGVALAGVEKRFKQHVKVENGIPLRSGDGTGDTWAVKRSSNTAIPLPLRKKKRSAGKRVGARVDREKAEKEQLKEMMMGQPVQADQVLNVEEIPVDCEIICDEPVDCFEVCFFQSWEGAGI